MDSTRRVLRPALALAVLRLAGCGGAGTGTFDAPLEAPPVDPAVVASPDETLSWRYLHRLETDFDADGAAERLTLTSDVPVGGEGTPLWEDGHRWAAYVEEPGGRTLVYSAFVPSGFVEAAAGAALAGGERAIVIVERTPRQLRVLEIDYQGPGDARLVTAALYPLDGWMPGFATLR